MVRTQTLKFNLAQRKEFDLALPRYNLKLGQTTKVMGILNLTPDSFSEDGIYKDPQRAKDSALKMIDQGADIIDVGGESTRPGAARVSSREEKARVLPIIRKLNKETKTPISIDTTKAEVAQAALAEGASIVNDISALKFDPRMAETVARFKAGCVLMHIQGSPQTMQEHPFYHSLIEEIIASLTESINKASLAGIDTKSLIIDPGIGFGKTTEHNLQIINRLKEFTKLDLPVLIGVSRKSFIGNTLGIPVQQRLLGTAVSLAASIFNGAHIIRVHDVKEMSQVAKMVDAILNS
ncbi:MAG: dihydropteroate synthase [Omnitrophica bacterium]|nr:dihydropteroate synthase [Candidatus Omnitrophota bacterium]